MSISMNATTALPTRQLGRTDLRITRVGFGSWAEGGDCAFGWGSQDDKDSIAAIRHAIACGINWIDTAAIYGLGHSESVVGTAFAEVPRCQRPYVFTKCGLIGNSDRATPELAALTRRQRQAPNRTARVVRVLPKRLAAQ